MAGFIYYDEIPVTTPPTIAELVASLSPAQKGAVLDGFTKDIKAVTLSRRALIDEDVVVRLYNKIKEIELYSRDLMRGEVLITPAEYDAEGNVITEAVYNTPVTTPTGLLNAVAAEFTEDFSIAQIEAIGTTMVNYSKHDGTGDWTFYSTEIVK